LQVGDEGFGLGEGDGLGDAVPVCVTVATAFPTVSRVVRAAPVFPAASMSIEALPVPLFCFAVSHESAIATVQAQVVEVVSCSVALAKEPPVPRVTEEGLRL
jgi:hypothetical protein